MTYLKPCSWVVATSYVTNSLCPWSYLLHAKVASQTSHISKLYWLMLLTCILQATEVSNLVYYVGSATTILTTTDKPFPTMVIGIGNGISQVTEYNLVITTMVM